MAGIAIDAFNYLSGTSVACQKQTGTFIWRIDRIGLS